MDRMWLVYLILLKNLKKNNLLIVFCQVGMKDKEIRKLIEGGETIVTLTIIPSFIYDHMMKKLSSSWIRGKMDHSIPGDDI